MRGGFVSVLQHLANTVVLCRKPDLSVVSRRFVTLIRPVRSCVSKSLSATISSSPVDRDITAMRNPHAVIRSPSSINWSCIRPASRTICSLRSRARTPPNSWRTATTSVVPEPTSPSITLKTQIEDVDIVQTLLVKFISDSHS